MKPINELAQEAHQQERKLAHKYQTPDVCWSYWFCKGYIKGEQMTLEKLTYWNDPKEHPQEGKMVLVKRTPDSPLVYDLAHIANGVWVDSWCGVIDLDDKIIGWRDINEQE